MGAGQSDGADKRIKHIKRRRAHGLPFRQLGVEFGVAGSTAHRAVKGKKPDQKAKSAENLQKSPLKSKSTPKSQNTVKTDRGTFKFKGDRKGD